LILAGDAHITIHKEGGMNRRWVLRSALAAALPGRTNTAKAQTRKEGVFIAGGEDRFHDDTMLPRCKLSAKDTNGALSILGGDHDNPGRAAAAANGKFGVPLHIHDDQDEFWYIVDGEYLFQIGDRKFRAKAADALFGPRRVPHSIRQLSEHGSLLSVLQPAGTIEDFFHELAQLRGGRVGRMPSPERLAELFRSHGMEIVGPVVEL
jgi:quercetin 2,3-dioxygenase